MFTDFQNLTVETSDLKINLLKGGEGYPILLLHGYPQNRMRP